MRTVPVIGVPEKPQSSPPLAPTGVSSHKVHEQDAVELNWGPFWEWCFCMSEPMQKASPTWCALGPALGSNGHQFIRACHGKKSMKWAIDNIKISLSFSEP